MVDELLDLRVCRVCGAPVRDNRDIGRGGDDVCASCAIAGSDDSGLEPLQGGQEAEIGLSGVDAELPAPPPSVDPDNPPWGPFTGLGTWAFSIAASIIIPSIPLVLIIFGKMMSGASPEEVQSWPMSPQSMLVLTIATFPAHVLILVFCWAVVTKFGKRPFFQSLGWNWAGRSALYWSLVSVGIVIAINVASNYLLRWLPDRPSPFEELLKSSPSVRIATVVLAVLSAPLVEEVVYRGVLFSGLRKRLNATASVLIVTAIFVGVHVPQYLGAWRTIAGLTLLSLALTILRARTCSLLPSFILHLLNNSIASAAIMFLETD